MKENRSFERIPGDKIKGKIYEQLASAQSSDNKL